MTEQPDRPRPTDNPVVTGLLALVGVGLALGLVVGLVALVGVKVAGIGGGDGSGDPAADSSMYLPTPSRTEGPSGPLITLAAEPSQSASRSASARPSRSPSASPSKDEGINLSVGTSAVGPMERIDLSGTYPEGEGAVLQVQRLQAGSWQDFDVTVVVSNGAFSTYVQTGQVGKNRFRVVDSDGGKTSNPVEVTVG